MKQIKFEWQGKPYTLEFTKNSIKQMERSGFVMSEVGDKPMTAIPTLFAGAFIANHRFIKNEIVDEIFQNLIGKAALIPKLGELYNAGMDALMDEPEEGNEKNVNWEASW